MRRQVSGVGGAGRKFRRGGQRESSEKLEAESAEAAATTTSRPAVVRPAAPWNENAAPDWALAKRRRPPPRDVGSTSR